MTIIMAVAAGMMAVPAVGDPHVRPMATGKTSGYAYGHITSSGLVFVSASAGASPTAATGGGSAKSTARATARSTATKTMSKETEEAVLAYVVCLMVNVYRPPSAALCVPPPLEEMQETSGTEHERQVMEAVVRQASAELQLPSPDPKVGPDPSLNKWNIVAVGYPIWLWVEGPRDLETTVTQDGITITIKARLRKVKFDMGDGTKKWCSSWTKWYRHGEPPRESPTCGYRYQQLPKKKGAGYDLTAEAHWDVTWTANGHTGTIETTRTATRHLNIAEIQSVITSRE